MQLKSIEISVVLISIKLHNWNQDKLYKNVIGAFMFGCSVSWNFMFWLWLTKNATIEYLLSRTNVSNVIIMRPPVTVFWPQIKGKSRSNILLDKNNPWQNIV